MSTETAQFPLGWDYQSSNDLSDYLISESNQAALLEVRSWPNWATHAVCIYGPEGCGKSHLAGALIRNTSVKVVKPSDSFESLQAYRHFIIEDYDQTSFDEDIIFHLYNWAKEQGGTLLVTARRAPSKWDVKLADLKSRFGLMAVLEISDPDDHLLEMIYYKLFSDRQIQVDATLIKYLLLHGERSFADALSNVNKLDREALARKCKVSRRLASEILTS